MSKRGATGQGDKENGLSNVVDAEETPQKATAAQMASRRIISAKGRRTAPNSNFSQASSLQSLGNPFAAAANQTPANASSQNNSTNIPIDPSIMNGFTMVWPTQPAVQATSASQNNQPFGSQQNQQQSSSFPPAQPSGSNNLFGGPSTPSSGFSFGAVANNSFGHGSSPGFGAFGQQNAQGQTGQQSNGQDGGMQISPPVSPFKGGNTAATPNIFGTMAGGGFKLFGDANNSSVPANANVSQPNHNACNTPSRVIYWQAVGDREEIAYLPGHEPIPSGLMLNERPDPALSDHWLESYIEDMGDANQEPDSSSFKRPLSKSSPGRHSRKNKLRRRESKNPSNKAHDSSSPQQPLPQEYNAPSQQQDFMDNTFSQKNQYESVSIQEVPQPQQQFSTLDTSTHQNHYQNVSSQEAPQTQQQHFTLDMSFQQNEYQTVSSQEAIQSSLPPQQYSLLNTSSQENPFDHMFNRKSPSDHMFNQRNRFDYMCNQENPFDHMFNQKPVQSFDSQRQYHEECNVQSQNQMQSQFSTPDTSDQQNNYQEVSYEELRFYHTNTENSFAPLVQNYDVQQHYGSPTVPTPQHPYFSMPDQLEQSFTGLDLYNNAQIIDPFRSHSSNSQYVMNYTDPAMCQQTSNPNPSQPPTNAFSVGGNTSVNAQPPQSPFSFSQSTSFGSTQPASNPQQSTPFGSFNFGTKAAEPAATGQNAPSAPQQSGLSNPFGSISRQVNGSTTSQPASAPSSGFFPSSGSTFGSFGANSDTNSTDSPSVTKTAPLNIFPSVISDSPFKGFGSAAPQSQAQPPSNSLFPRLNNPVNPETANSTLSAINSSTNDASNNNASTNNDLINNASTENTTLANGAWTNNAPSKNFFENSAEVSTTTPSFAPVAPSQQQPPLFPMTPQPASVVNPSHLVTPAAGEQSTPALMKPQEPLGAIPAAFSNAQKGTYSAHLELRRLNESLRRALESMSVGENWSDIMRAYLSEYDKLMGSNSAVHEAPSSSHASSTPHKRKAGGSIPNEDPKKSRSNNIMPTSPSQPVETTSGKSQTANLFQSIVENKDSTLPSTPVKQGLNFQTPSTTPAGPPPTKLSTPNFTANTASGSNLFGNLPKASSQLAPSTNMFSTPQPSKQTLQQSSLTAPQPSKSGVQHHIAGPVTEPIASNPTQTPTNFPSLRDAKPLSDEPSREPKSKMQNPFAAFTPKSNPTTEESVKENAAVATPATTPFQFKPSQGGTSTSAATPFQFNTLKDGGFTPTTSPFQFIPSNDSTSKLAAFPSFTPIHKSSNSSTSASTSASVTGSIVAPAAQPNFMSQFGSKAAEDAEKAAAAAKAKQKAEEFDSEEDDEEEWERNYAEQQAKKKEAAANVTKPPSFGSSSGSFVSQFAKSAEEMEAKEKAKRKAEEFDSEEDDESEWERKYEEEQRRKKAKLSELKDNGKIVFVAGKGLVPEEATNRSTTQAANVTKPSAAPATETAKSVFASSSKPQTSTGNNIFGHLSNEGSRNASDDDDDDADAEEEDDKPHKRGRKPASKTQRSQKSSIARNDSDDESLETTMRHRAQEVGSTHSSQRSATPSRSLFDRVSPADSGDDNSTKGGNASKAASINLDGASDTKTAGSSSIFGKSIGGDHTWKANSQINFGTAPPVFNFTPATPSKPGVANGTESTTPAGKPFAGLFGTPKFDSTPSLFNIQKSNEIGFGFGGPPKADGSSTPFLFPSMPGSTFSSAATSRATSPGAPPSLPESTNGVAADNDGEDAAPPEAQRDFTALTADEKRDEDILFEIEKARCMIYNKDSSQPWETKGTGPLRVLKNKNTGNTRVLLRSAPAGKVVVNSRVQKNYSYTHTGKGQVRMMIANAMGKPETYAMKMAGDGDAKEFAQVCEANKGS